MATASASQSISIARVASPSREKTRLPVLHEEMLPPLYDKWIRELLGRGVPREERATCEACPMVDDSSSSEIKLGRFSSLTKCCTYTPELPNFLAGMVLADNEPATETGRATLRARIERRIAITPLFSRHSTYDGSHVRPDRRQRIWT